MEQQLPPPIFLVCSISLNRSDRMRLIGVPEQLIPGFRAAVAQGWPRGIQNEFDYYGSYEFKFKGNPWYGYGRQHACLLCGCGGGDEAVSSRTLIIAVLTFMARNGWNLFQSTDTSKKPFDKDTLFFEYGQPDPNVQIFSLSFNMHDRIRMIGAPEIMPVVRRAVLTYWTRGIQNESEYCGALELKLRGTPWWADGGDTVLVRVLLNHMLADIRGLGFKLYGSIDISAGEYDLESWFFRLVNPIWQ